MSETSKQYIKFMSDIIESGLWGRLGPAARTLYPVLLKFSDQNFKHVWPSTETLLKLTGFKTKKSISIGKKELIMAGLLQYRPGSGRVNSTYFFSFSYEGSKITPQWDTPIPPRVGNVSYSGGSSVNSQGDQGVTPNNLNITINNTQTNKPYIKKDMINFDKLIEIYGFTLVDTALQFAKTKNLENNISYVHGVCRNLVENSGRNVPNRNHGLDIAQHVIDSWKSFLNWSKSHLTRSSVDILESIPIDVDGKSIFIRQNINDFLKQIILKYFNEEISPPILIIFLETVNSHHYETS